MGIDACITSGARQVLVLTVWDVKVGLGVTVLLGQAKIDHVDLVPTLTDAHQKVVRLDVTMDEGFGMNVLDARDELIGEEEDRLQGEFAVAEVEEILQAGTQEIKHHGIVVTLGPIPTHKGYAHTSGERFVDASLVLELRVFGFDTFELDGDFLSRDDIGTCRRLVVFMTMGSHIVFSSSARTEVNVSETSTTDLSPDSVLVAHAKILPNETC